MIERDELALLGETMRPHLDERQWRLLSGATARSLGRGGASAVAQAWGMSRNTVITGKHEVEAGAQVAEQVRRPGAGRKPKEDIDPEILAALDSLVEPTERGDPMCVLRWTTKSLRKLSDELARLGWEASPPKVAEMLRLMGYSLRAPHKTIEGNQHPDRDAQFRNIAETAQAFADAGQPVISIDTKKKELVGNYENPGQEWRPEDEPRKVNGHDFPDPEVPKAVPYGVYDVFGNAGWICVGEHNDTATFAVESMRRWWTKMGKTAYPNATHLLVTADCGGSNAARSRLFKTELAAFAAETGLEITVCHFPPGTSKWNKIEHRLFSHITMNWKRRTLDSFRTVIELISATTTRTGLRAQAEHDTGYYPKGTKVTNAELAAVPLERHT